MSNREVVKHDIDQATDELMAKVHALEHRATEMKERAVALKDRVAQSANLQHQIDERPWVVFGGAVATGALIAIILS